MFGLLLGNQTPKFYHKPSNRAITNPIAMNRKMAGTVSLERNTPASPAITRKDPALPHRPGLKSYAMRLRRRYKTGLFYERTYPLPFHFYERFSTPDLLCGQRRPLQNPSPASGRDKRGPPVSSQNPSPASGRDKRGPPESSQNRKDSPVFGRAALVAAGRGGGRTRRSASLPRAASGGSSLSSAGRRRDRRPWRTRAPKCCTSRRSRT